MSNSATPWTASHQASLSITNSWSLLKLKSIDPVMPSNHLILCHPLLLQPSIFPRIRVSSNESALCIRCPKYWSFSFNISPSTEYSGLISFRINWLDLLAVLNIHWKDWCWSWNSNTLATWCKDLNHLKRPWCWERLKTGGEGDDIGWDGWIASLTQSTWVWANSWRWWENRAAWCAAVQGVAKSWTWLSNWTTIIV